MKILGILTLILSCQVWAGNSVNNGGDLLPEDKVDAFKIQDAVSYARIDLLLHLNFLSLQNFNAPIVEKFLKASPSIFEIIKTVEISARLAGPCTDESGKESDGSSGSGLESVCISVSRLQGQLTESNLWPEVIALAAHEYSHRAGFDEADATNLQKQILRNLLPFSQTQVVQGRTKFLDYVKYFRNSESELVASQVVYQNFLNYSEKIGRGDFGPNPSLWSDPVRFSISARPVEYFNRIRTSFKSLGELPMSGLSHDEYFEAISYMEKARAFAIGICLLGKPCGDWKLQPLPPVDRSRYASVFGPRFEVPLSEFVQTFGSIEPPKSLFFRVRKIGALPEVQLEIADLSAGFQKFERKIGFLQLLGNLARTQ